MSEPQAQTATSWLDNFVGYVKLALDIVQLKEEAIDKARLDEEAFTMGLAVIALGGIAASIGTLNPFGVVAFPIFFLVGAFIGAAVLHLIATVAFGGEGEFMEFFRPFSLSYVLSWVNVVPGLNVILAPLAGLWLCAVAVICVERTYGLERVRAIATVAIPVVVMFVLSMMFATLVGMAVLLSMR